MLSRYLDAIMIRTHAHTRVQELAAAASVPVINGLTDEHHPCQALADLQVLRERLGGLAGRRLAWVGDGGSNVCHSLAAAASLTGMEVVVAAPAGYEPVAAELGPAASHRGRLRPGRRGDRRRCRRDRHVYEHGPGGRARVRLAALAPYQVNTGLLEHAAPGHVVLHCLPAHCGEEITREVLWGPSSAVWDEAENRLHAQKALLAMIVE